MFLRNEMKDLTKEFIKKTEYNLIIKFKSILKMYPKNYLTSFVIIILVSCGGGGGGALDPESPSIFNPVINTFSPHQHQFFG